MLDEKFVCTHSLERLDCSLSNLSHDTLKDSPQPHCSVMLGFLNTNLALNLSSSQSISLPIMLNKALLSIRTLTPSCSTTSSNAFGFSTYSRWYARPEQPLFFTPTLIILWSCSSRSFRCSRAGVLMVIAALRGLNFFLGFFAGVDSVFCSATGLEFCASRSGKLIDAVSCISEVGFRVSFSRG